jgi:hypothetical protein
LLSIASSSLPTIVGTAARVGISPARAWAPRRRGAIKIPNDLLPAQGRQRSQVGRIQRFPSGDRRNGRGSGGGTRWRRRGITEQGRALELDQLIENAVAIDTAERPKAVHRNRSLNGLQQILVAFLHQRRIVLVKAPDHVQRGFLVIDEIG